jgi:hypothetical protein
MSKPKKQPSLRKSERVMNESEEAVRTQSLAMRNKDDDIEKQEQRVRTALANGKEKQATYEAAELRRLRLERASMESQIDRLREGQLGFRDVLGEFQTQQHLRNMSEEASRLFKTTDLAGMVKAGVESDWHTEGLSELREVTGASEEKQSQRTNEVDSILEEMRSQVTTPPPVNNTNAVIAQQKTAARPVKSQSKYRQADDLLTFL